MEPQLKQVLYNLSLLEKPGQSIYNFFRKKENIQLYNQLKQQYNYQDSKFSIELVYLFYHSLKTFPTCKTCKVNKTSFISFQEGFRPYCSDTCANKDPLHGGFNSLDTQKKIQKIQTQKTGYKTPFFNKEVQEKIKDTFIEKYGVDNPMKTKEILEKSKKSFQENWVLNLENKQDLVERRRNTMFENYGINYWLQDKENNEQVQQKRQTTLLEHNYNSYITKLQDVEPLFSIQEYKEKGIMGKYKFKCKKCNYEFIDYSNYNGGATCPICHPKIVSSPEVEIFSLFESLGVSKEDIIKNDRTVLKGKELDLYLPKYKLAIEYNGLMFHSFGKSKYNMFNNSEGEGVQKLSHLIKTEQCVQQDINLLHIFENEWLDPVKKEIWISIIKNKVLQNRQKVYARDCIVKQLTSSKKDDFLEKNHLQGKDSSSIYFGLVHNDILVSVMTFGKSRYRSDTTYELYRYANKTDTNTIGGASKLFSYFKKQYMKQGETLVSYADRRFSLGKIYQQLGFKLSHISEPNYFYFKEDNTKVIYSRQNFQKSELSKKLLVYDEFLTESENMYNNGYRKIYDSGNLVYIFRFEQ